MYRDRPQRTCHDVDHDDDDGKGDDEPEFSCLISDALHSLMSMSRSCCLICMTTIIVSPCGLKYENPFKNLYLSL